MACSSSRTSVHCKFPKHVSCTSRMVCVCSRLVKLEVLQLIQRTQNAHLFDVTCAGAIPTPAAFRIWNNDDGPESQSPREAAVQDLWGDLEHLTQAALLGEEREGELQQGQHDGAACQLQQGLPVRALLTSSAACCAMPCCSGSDSGLADCASAARCIHVLCWEASATCKLSSDLCAGGSLALPTGCAGFACRPTQQQLCWTPTDACWQTCCRSSSNGHSCTQQKQQMQLLMVHGIAHSTGSTRMNSSSSSKSHSWSRIHTEHLLQR